MFGRSCRQCRFSAGVPREVVSSVCRFDPPEMRFIAPPKPDEPAQISSTFPPVNMDAMRCGKFKRRPLWWRIIGRTG